VCAVPEGTQANHETGVRDSTGHTQREMGIQPNNIGLKFG